MISYVDGYSYPMFEIYDTDDNLIESISLNLCGSEGMVEEYEPFGIVHNLLTNSRITKWKGFHIHFSLSYSEYSDLQNTLKIKRLINYFFDNKYKIKIIPRADFSWKKYEVVYSGESIEKGIMKGGIKAIGNRLITLKFRTKDIQTSLNWMSSSDVYSTMFSDFAVI